MLVIVFHQVGHHAGDVYRGIPVFVLRRWRLSFWPGPRRKNPRVLNGIRISVAARNTGMVMKFLPGGVSKMIMSYSWATSSDSTNLRKWSQIWSSKVRRSHFGQVLEQLEVVAIRGQHIQAREDGGIRHHIAVIVDIG